MLQNFFDPKDTGKSASIYFTVCFILAFEDSINVYFLLVYGV